MTSTMSRQRLALAAGMSVILASATTQATTAVNSGDWSTPATWDSGVPIDSSDAIIPAGRDVTNTTGSARLNSLDVGGKLTFSGWSSAVTANTVVVGGTVTHLPQTATTTNASGLWVADNRVHFVCTNFTLNSGGSINVDYRGYSGGPTSPSAGRGPGGSRAVNNSGGGGYGGSGNGGYGYVEGGITYGSVSAPIDPGSGAGNSYGTVGGAGGGAVRIDANGSAAVNGTISARGQNGLASWGGTGSGGGVYIACQTFTGTGTISVIGGSSSGENYGGGGGGRIAIAYAPGAQAGVNPKPTVRFDAGGGLGRTDNDAWKNVGRGSPGTVYLPDTNFYPSTTFDGGAFVAIPNFTNWAPDSLLISNVWVRFADGFRLAATNDVTISGPYGRYTITNQGVLTCGGNLFITNGAGLFIFPAPTNGTLPDYGALISIGKDIVIATNGWIYPYSDPTNGGSVLFRCDNLRVLTTNAGLNADAHGFAGGGWGYGNNGYGPGGTPAQNPALGAGHGGRGGGVGGFTGGSTYGSSNMPTLCGSGSGTGYGQLGACGGGVIRVEAVRDIILNGALTANGMNGQSSWGTGGSGGSIYLRCRIFGGNNGVLSVRGGDGGNENPNGAGGGRIAVWRNADAYSGLVTNISGGVDNNPGEIGTLYWGVIGLPGTVIVIQ